LHLGKPVTEAVAELVGRIFRLRAAVAGGDRAGGGDTGGAGETQELPSTLHGSRRLLAVTVSALGFDEAIATAATGDIWLFRGRSLADRAIQTMTNSPVNHVGMVVALEDMPPLLWHAELGKSLPDAWTGERQRGVQLHNLADAVRTWDEKYGQRAWMRRLEGTLEREHEDRLIETIDKYDGKPFPTTPGLMRSWATGRVRRREVSRETIYCAELVAITMQNMGLLPDKRPMSWYDPGKFWSGDEVVLLEPFALSGEIQVTPA
jgi:hypothetical protein